MERILFWAFIIIPVLVVANTWLLLVALGGWWNVKTSGPTELASANAGGSGQVGNVATQIGQSQPQTAGVWARLAHQPPSAGDAADAQLFAMSEGNGLICMTWNLGRRTHTGHADVIRDSKADIIALQEVSHQHQPTLARGLAAQGLVHQHGNANAARSFPFNSLIASRWPIRGGDTDVPDVPFPERVQVAIVATPFGDVEVLNVHVPAATSSGVAVKIATFEGIARYLSNPALVPRIVLGDFNTPKSEASGRVEYWGNAVQQRAERAVIEGEATRGLRDAFRQVNGPSATAASWRASNGVARRYDHIFASVELVPIEATYGDLEQMRSERMSDHAPLRVVFKSKREAAEQGEPVHKTQPEAGGLEEKPTPVQTTSAPVPREEYSMATANDAELHEFLKSLTYGRDVREHPNDDHRREFRTGWNKASQGPAISDRTLRDRLTWANLGYRAGKAFGPASDAKLHAMFDRFAAIYQRGPAEADQDP